MKMNSDDILDVIKISIVVSTALIVGSFLGKKTSYNDHFNEVIHLYKDNKYITTTIIENGDTTFTYKPLIK